MKVELNSRKLRFSLVVLSLVFLLGMNASLYFRNTNALVNLNSFDNPFSFKNLEFSSQQTDSYINQDFSGEYNPIINKSDVGSAFSAKDVVTVYDDQYLNLTFNEAESIFEVDFFIDPLSGRDLYNSSYNILDITAKNDWYPIEDEANSLVNLDENLIAISQGFEVIWEYAVFDGAKIFLEQDGFNIESNEMELLLVKADELTNEPNMTDVLSSDSNNPYSLVNPITNPVSIDNLVFYDFTNTILEKGKYFVVANLTDPTNVLFGELPKFSPKHIQWWGMNTLPLLGDTYYRSSDLSWTLQAIDHTFIPLLMPSDEYGSVKIFDDPTLISLQDNDQNILTLLDPISSIGTHTLTSDTSVEININNSYSFSIDTLVTSSYYAYNSSFNDYSIDWNLTWAIEEADYSPYSSFSRTQILFIPNDWNNSFICYYNVTEIFGVKITEGYIVSLDSISSSGVIKLYTTSPNYVQQLLLSDETSVTDTFTLGYWTTDSTNAFGQEGSTVISDVTLKDSETTGTLNFTVVNPAGVINPLKTSLPSNLTYLDTSEYSISGITSSAPGIFTSSISFDPSVYGSEEPGLWSVFIFWSNGTEIGIFSSAIKVKVSTDCECSWEVIPDSNDWTSNSTATLLRANGDSLDFEAYYFTNSEPFFENYGPSIQNASVRYSTSWGESGSFDDTAPFYSTSIFASATTGMHTIVLTAYNNETLDITININLEIFNVYTIEPVNTAIEINSTDEAIIQFRVINETDPAKGAIFPDEFTLTINDNPVSSLYYLYDTEGDLNIISIRMADYGVSSGTVNLGLSISKANFKAGYIQDSVAFTFSVTVNPVNGNGEFPMKLIIAIVVPSVVIILSLVTYLLATSKSRKLEKPLVDVSDKSAVVHLFDSVLSMKKVLFIHAETSLPVFELNAGHEIEVDTALISGFLAVVARMGKQIGGMETGDIRKLEYRNFVVNSASSDVYTLFLFSTEDIYPGILKKLFDLVMWFHYTFTIKGDWDGRIELFTDKRNLIQDKIAETLYLWVYFPLEFDAKKESEIKKIEGLNPRVVNFLKKNKEVTISSILNNYPDIPLEETLTTIFKLVNKGVLIRRQFSSFAGKR